MIDDDDDDDDDDDVKREREREKCVRCNRVTISVRTDWHRRPIVSSSHGRTSSSVSSCERKWKKKER